MVIHCQCLFYGVARPQDFGRGIHSLLKIHCSASSDEILATTFTLLGDVWANGLIGGVVDHELAQDYYRVAIEEYEFTAGPCGAGVFWDPAPLKGTPQSKIADADLAAEYYSMAAEAGNAAAAFKLSMLMATGKIRPAPREYE